LTTDIITKVVFSTTWELLSSTKNRGVVVATAAIVELVGIAHQSAILYQFPLLFILLFPRVAKSDPVLHRYAGDMVTRRIKLKEQQPDIKDMFGQYTTATDPESKTGQPLPKGDVLINSMNLIVAGTSPSSNSEQKLKLNLCQVRIPQPQP